MVRIGLVGVGFMGRIHFLAARRLRGGSVVAICSRDAAKRAGDWTNTRGNFGPEPGFVDLAGVNTYEHFDQMLGDPSIDLIDICTVTDQHAAMAISALKAGKHVLVEKAIALDIPEADAMLEAENASGKLLMVAHVLPFFREFAFAADAVRTKSYGRLLGAQFTRVIAQPDWSTGIGDARRTGGPAVDLHIHDTHFIGLLAGVPNQVFSSGNEQEGAVSYLSTQYLYGSGGPTISACCGASARPGRPFVHGFEIYLEQATLSHSSAGIPLTLITDRSEVVALEESGDPIAAFTAELQAAVDGVSQGRTPDVLSGKLARDALALCHREIESVRAGRVVSV